MKKLTKREQAQLAYDEILSRFRLATDPSEKQRLALELDAAFDQIPPASTRQKINAAYAHPLITKHMHIESQKRAILHALTKGNVELFFRDVQFLPELFADTELMENTLVGWMLTKFSKNARGDAARNNLKRLAEILTKSHGAPAYETKEERDAARQAHERARSAEYYDKKRKKKKPSQ